MKMLNISLFTLIASSLVIFKCANAQTASLSIRTPLSVSGGEEKGFINNIIGLDASGHYYMMMSNKNELHLQKMDTNFNEIKQVRETKILVDGNKDMELKMVFLVKDKLIAFFKRSSDSKTELILFDINKSTLLSDKPGRTIAELSFKEKSQVADFRYAFSPRKNNLLVLSKVNDTKDAPERYEFTMLNNEFNIIWKKKLSDDSFVLKNLYSDDDGRAYLTGITNGEWCVKMISDQNSEPLTYLIKPNGEIGSIECLPDTLSNSFCISGFYRRSKERPSLSGYFFRRLDRVTFTEQVKTDIKVEDLFIKGLKNPVQDYYLRNMTLKEILCNNDGSCYLIAEMNDRSEIFSSGEISVLYKSEKLLVFKLNKEGKPDWIINIPKEQSQFETENRFLLSYGLAIKDGKLFIIFNDNKNNYANTEIMTPEKAGFYDKNASLTICTLNSTGELSRKKLIDCEKKCDIAIMPRGCWQISNHRLLITMQGKNERSFGILNLE